MQSSICRKLLSAGGTILAVGGIESSVGYTYLPNPKGAAMIPEENVGIYLHRVFQLPATIFSHFCDLYLVSTF